VLKSRGNRRVNEPINLPVPEPELDPLYMVTTFRILSLFNQGPDSCLSCLKVTLSCLKVTFPCLNLHGFKF